MKAMSLEQPDVESALASKLHMHPQVRCAGELGAFTLVAFIVYLFLMWGVVVGGVYGVTADVLVDPVTIMQFASQHRFVVVAIYTAPFVAAFALNALLIALRQAHGRQRALADAAWFAGAFGSVAAIVEASTALVGVPTLAGVYLRDQSVAIAGMISVAAIANGLHMVNFVGWGAAILLASLAARRERTMPLALAGYGVLAGLAGIATLFVLQPLFFVQLAFVPWFAAVGWKLRTPTASRARETLT